MENICFTYGFHCFFENHIGFALRKTNISTKNIGFAEAKPIVLQKK